MIEDEKKITIDDIITTMKKNNRKVDVKKIKKIYDYACKMHGKQKRLSGESFIEHPLRVAEILVKLELDEDSICAALLHDVVEDTEATIDEIKKLFGVEIAEMINGVTKLKSFSYTTKEEEQIENYRKMFLAMGKDTRVVLIKLADRLHNMRTLNYMTVENQRAKAKETMDIYAPLANRLGIFSLKWELEDLAFKYLHPEEYDKINKGLKAKKEERLKFLQIINDTIKKNLKNQKIVFDIQSREKHYYSIYRKMKRDNCELDSIYDLFAIRILVNSLKDCYTALGVVHELYSPMQGRFKDYIAVPKANMYQSIHTTLIGTKGVPFEVQIRTWEMHRIAEFGIAAHWAYKEANKIKKSNVTVKEDKLSWLRETIESQNDAHDPEEFMKALKTELFEDEVYLFTPKGQIKILPKGANAIDMAYSIHEQVGHKMVGAKINGKMKPIITTLENGDIVEIITSDTSKGPSRDWLKLVKSSSAKTRIQQWYKKAERETNIIKGKDLLEKEIKKIGLSNEELLKPEWLKIVMDRYKIDTMDELYSSIGFGNLGVGKIISRLLVEYRKEHKELDLEAKIHDLNEDYKKKRVVSSNGIIVKNIENCLVKLSKCCNPLAGDEIIGYITRGRGVTVHRRDCANMTDLLYEENRLIDVEWEKNAKTKYNVEITIGGTDRHGLLADIVKELTASNIQFNAFNAKVVKNQMVVADIILEIEDIKELNKAYNSIKRVEGIDEVDRKR